MVICWRRRQVGTHPLHPCLADVELPANDAYRGNVTSRKVIGEHPCGFFPQGIARRHRICSDRASRHLSTPNDHHEQVVRSNQRDSRPRTHCSTDQAVTQTVRDVRREGRGNSHTE